MSYVDDLQRCEEMQEKLNDVVEHRARQIAELRRVQLSWRTESYYFDGYERTVMSDYMRKSDSYALQYESNTELLLVTFTGWCGDQPDHIHIMFPLTYLDDPNWTVQEQVMIDKIEADKAVLAQNKADEARQRKLDQYNKLSKELFG